jgi:hypothetical protein
MDVIKGLSTDRLLYYSHNMYEFMWGPFSDADNMRISIPFLSGR